MGWVQITACHTTTTTTTTTTTYSYNWQLRQPWELWSFRKKEFTNKQTNERTNEQKNKTNNNKKSTNSTNWPACRVTCRPWKRVRMCTVCVKNKNSQTALTFKLRQYDGRRTVTIISITTIIMWGPRWKHDSTSGVIKWLNRQNQGLQSTQTCRSIWTS